MKYEIVLKDGTYYAYRIGVEECTLIAETPIPEEAETAIVQDGRRVFAQRLRDWGRWPRW